MRDARRRIATLALASGMAFASAVARADSTTDNATTQSNDAFGRAVGTEKTGLYNSDDVRGFNPIEAGNARIEGLYFDQVDRIPGRLRPVETIRVGLSSQRFPFPAPTGLVDYELVKVTDHFTGHTKLAVAEFNSPDFRLQFNVPFAGDRLGLFAGGGMRLIHRAEGERSLVYNYALLLQAKPYVGAEIAVFGGLSHTSDDEARPILFSAGSFLPPQIERRKFLGQPWAKRAFDTPFYGATARLPIGPFRLEAGLFYNERDYHTFYADLLSGVTPGGAATSRTIIADGGNIDQSLSGESRLVWDWGSGALHHSLTAGLRGRHKQRLFGGSQTIALGPSSAIDTDFRPAPALTIGPKSHDDVKQLTYGVSYNLFWAGRANFDVSISKSSYRKAVDFADPALRDLLTRDSPLLWNVAASYALTRRLTLYAGMARGQEEAQIAPDIAINRDESPPALRTKQVEAGFRYALTPHIGLLAGLFSITKPYYNLDPALRFRQLGTIRNRGIELSLTGQIVAGVTVVAGTLLLDPRISGEVVYTGLIGPRPVGQIRRRSVANFDWRPGAGTSAWSFDLAVENVSARNANAKGTLSAPPHTTINMGARYRFALSGMKMLLRPQIQNVSDSYGWNVSSSGGFSYVASRSGSLELLIDF
jgi:iron complex outermembrane receptor protein